MAAIKNIGIKSQTSSKIYIKGYADNLETGYNYCIVYCYGTGANQNVGNNNYDYTFIKLSDKAKGSYQDYDFGSRGLYIPNEGWGIYGVKIVMVGNTCEDVHIEEDAKYIPVSEAPTPPPDEEPYIPPTPPACNEGETVCEYNAAYNRYMIKKCVSGKMVFDRWCGTDDTCEGGVCISPPTPPEIPTPPACEEGALVCEYNEGQQRYLIKKCVSGKMVFERWCGADDTCEGGVCIPPQKPECKEGDKKAGYICEGGKWVAYTPPVVPPVEPPVEPPVTPPAEPPKYLTHAQADERIRAGLPCYIKCTLPILDMLPGIPYTPGAWVLPFCAITSEP